MTSETANRYQLNAMRIQGALKRAPDKDGNLIATGEVRKGFEWVFEDDSVICCEFLRGTTLQLVIFDRDILSIDSRRVSDLSLFNAKVEWILGVELANFTGMLEKFKDQAQKNHNQAVEVIGIVPDTGVTNDGPPKFYPIEHMVKRMKYSQWGKLPKTIENISNWLREDLGSHLPDEHKARIGAGITSHSYKHRPWGLMFVNSEGRFARITSDCFPWFYEERLHRRGKKKSRVRTSKETWEGMNDAEREAFRVKARAERHSR